VRRSGLRYAKKLCFGVTQYLDPIFTFTDGGKFCALQPKAPLESASTRKVFAQIFGKPGSGPAQINLQMRRYGVKDRRSSLWKERFNSANLEFIELEVKELPREKGYYQTNELPLFLAELRKTVDAIVLSDYDISSERSFLESLPRSYTIENLTENYYGIPYGGAAAFAIARLLCGEIDVFERIRASGISFGPVWSQNLARVEEFANEIEPLAV